MGYEGEVPETGGGRRLTCPDPVAVVATGRMSGHRVAAVEALARRIAALRGSAFVERPADVPRCYAVPADTLIGGLVAGQLGIESESDLFGGLVPYEVQAGKAITHELIDGDAPHPEGWSAAFSHAAHTAVLTGFSAFDLASARKAGEALLAEGPVRLKAAWADGGHGQRIVGDLAALAAALEALDTPELPRLGLVLEQDIAEGVTFSVGRMRIGDQLLSYVGEQFTTRDNKGASAYGGSTLTVVRGELDALRQLDLDSPTRQAVEATIIYDGAAMQHLPGLIASRRNYDVVSGRDARGNPRAGVLEQSWRIGGASGAEIAAFEAFADNPRLAMVRAACCERYGTSHEVPRDAFVYFDGDDADVGPMIKFARIEARSETEEGDDSRAF
ncbi:DUF3182 family protein [Ancylobacter sp. G4_0304]|uniref:DUF3182 family protein n=1 Tax=Ancylobacter sp. G4_0304 TaxID=3114289 RepID=UPI0039C67B60